MIIPLKFHYFYTTFPYFRFGHFGDRTFFVTPAVTQFPSLLSVIYIDSLFVCLPMILLSFISLLCSGKLPLRRGVKSGLYNKCYTIKKEERNFPLLFLHIILCSIYPRFQAVFLFLLILPLERIRYVHAAAKATVLATVTVDADVRFPRIRLGGFQPHTNLATYAGALDAG